MAKTGNLSINSENMLPIIKKWLYSDHDIFVRELVANGCDAITKLKKLEGVGEYKPAEEKPWRIDVITNPDEKTLTFVDNGIGMTEDEVVEYITQIAFSGASKFLEKYKGKTDEDQIIGHFGLGFYSAFMVADEVHIDTLSYQEGAKAVHWESDGTSTYSIDDSDWDQIGTRITLFLNENSLEFCNEFRVKEVLEKYCSFMPVEIWVSDEGPTADKRRADEKQREEENNRRRYEDAKKRVEEAEAKGEKPSDWDVENAKGVRPYVPVAPQPVNDIHPLWAKLPKDCTDDDYKAFYRKVFKDYKEPLFWIHLNMDYPFNLRGILYFPRVNTEYDALEAEIKLYNNQVFIADNIKEVIPEFLMALKGVIDCPDLPLNVSRSALQNDGFVKKISEYISRKVADKLSGMCKTDRENYEKCWDDINPFIKFGCIRDAKFADRMMDYILFKDLDGKYLTLKEYKEKNNIPDEAEKADEPEVVDSATGETISGSADAAAEGAEKAEAGSASSKEDAENADAAKEPEQSTVYYVTDEVQQAQYISMFRAAKKDAVILRHAIDSAFITQLEQRNQNLKFARIDAELGEDFLRKTAVKKKDVDSLTKTFQDALKKERLEIQVSNMKDKEIAAILTLSEESRRMMDMMKMYGMDSSAMGGYGASETLVLNAAHPLVKYILANPDSENVPILCEQLYDLAALSHKPLTQEEMTKFVKRSNEIMVLLTK